MCYGSHNTNTINTYKIRALYVGKRILNYILDLLEATGEKFKSSSCSNESGNTLDQLEIL